MKRWWTIGVETELEWPKKQVVAQYAGRAIFLLVPEDERMALTVGVAYNDASIPDPPFQSDTTGEPRCSDEKEARRVLKRFLSVLAWCCNCGITEYGGGGGPLHTAIARPHRKGHLPSHIFDLYFDRLPVPKDDDGRIALALYREALSVDNISYRFLSFAKVLNVRLRKGEDQIGWINKNLDQITEPAAHVRIETLKKNCKDVGDYLYYSGRCAVAHALGEPRVDPDDSEDALRLSEDMPVIQALARHFIEHELGVKSLATIAREREEEWLRTH